MKDYRWTLGTPEPKWNRPIRRARWRSARRCSNCNGMGQVRMNRRFNVICPDCKGRGYYRAGGLYGDYNKESM